MHRSRSVDSALDTRSPNTRYNLRVLQHHDVIMEGGSSDDNNNDDDAEEMRDLGAARIREVPARKAAKTTAPKVKKPTKSSAARTTGVKGRRKLRQDADPDFQQF